jgi:ATP-dependent exoDNAse (exonuclease V) beta subunit
MRNERLIANAGSGKTHALTSRMIQLLAQGVEPQKIAALTFTRKSAGEFLSALFKRLAEAALDSSKLAELRTNEHLQDLDADRCRAILAQLGLQLGRLGMGTIDSLFARIARAFPLESGLAEDFSMAGEAQIDAACERTLAELFANEASDSLADFIDLLRRINRNHGERDVFHRLLGETKSLHEKFLATPRGVAWGDALAIWPEAGGCHILNAGAVGPAADAFLKAVLDTHAEFSVEARGVLQANLDLLKSLDSGGRWNSQISKFVKTRLCAEPTSGILRITSQKAGWLDLNERVRPARLVLLQSALRPEFEFLLTRSKSLHAFMQKFEDAYSALVRSSGIVTFGDITDSLAQRAADVAWNATAGYRIDQTFDHWLLDEFQDTSRSQWKILKTFIDEVVMDPEGQRSFFYVGDTKQAIYTWRGGDPNLFFEIFDALNENAQIIHDAPPLDQSWRSCQPILDFVNKVFGDLGSVKQMLEIPDVTAERWTMAWSEHITSPGTRSIHGYAEWVSVPKNDGDDEDQGDAPDRKVLEILQATRAWERGLSCAVLKRDNNSLAALSSLLQSNDIPVAVEGKTNPCVDNPLGAALIAALRVVASPDDKLSLEVVRGFSVSTSWGLDDVWKFRRETLASLAQRGFAATMRHWIKSSNLDGEPFLQERAASFLLAAEEFDSCRKSSDGILDFLRFVENRRTQENEASGVVRIMTVHQSKGLGFDMVIASGLDKKGRTNDGNRVALGPTASDLKWGVLMPPMDFAEQDETLRKQLELEVAEKKYGEICTAYVALTRAKIALYVVTTELRPKTDSTNFARHLLLQFGGSSVQFGDAKWYEAYDIRNDDSMPALVLTAFHAPLYGTPKPSAPSSFKAESTTGSDFVGLSFDAADLGTEVHEILSRIQWIEAHPAQMDFASREATKLVNGFLQKPIAKEAFSKPQAPVDLWREKAFDVMLEGQWVSGVFDRVVIHRTQDGKPASAVIYDFKTDYGTASEIEERYAGQMEVYRKATCVLLGLSKDHVKSQILCIR